MDSNDLLIIVAFVCFAISAVWSGVTKSWTLALIAAGLAFWVLTGIQIEVN